jgi:hypothetical protein
MLRFVSESQGPARGYSWPPALPENTLALKHGARSDRFVEPLAAAFRDALLADRPDLAAYPEEVAAWSTWEARAERYRLYHAKNGLIDERGHMRGGQYALIAERMAQKCREALGLTPKSAIELRKLAAETTTAGVQALDALRAEGRATLERRVARGELTVVAEPAGA